MKTDFRPPKNIGSLFGETTFATYKYRKYPVSLLVTNPLLTVTKTCTKIGEDKLFKNNHPLEESSITLLSTTILW